YDATLELGDDAGSGFAGGSVAEYGAADWESAGCAGAGRAAGAECLGGRRVDCGFGGYVDDEVEDSGAGDYAGYVMRAARLDGCMCGRGGARRFEDCIGGGGFAL